ncbi:PBSX family phage terminase large subunit [Kutzneria viridogrisea]|uniref:PBSX family phage terminase large subunit n=1 Tax=Kutzneria viridogrisea TaxID=47990 RepID=A0ABR6BAV9_9PSEU|nr:PBSX family phage terminase large subunit [Kutzneria viridogrisea]
MAVTPLVGKQRESLRLATARWNIWEGAVRSSKTVCSILNWLRYVRTGPSGNLLMVGKTERTLKRNVIDPIQEMVGKRRCRYREGAGELDLFGRTIYTVGANNELASDKIKGLTLSGAYCDEVTTYPQSFFSMLGTRLSTDGAQGFGTTNPEGPNHWFKKDYLDRASLHLTRDGRIVESADPGALDLHRFTFQLADNPTLSASYVDALKREYVGLFYRRFVLGEWVLAQGAIYDMWDPDRHVVDILPRIDRWIGLGVDYGTVNPFAGLVLGLGADGRLYLTNEWRYDSKAARRSLTDHEYSERLRGWLARIPHPGAPSVLGVHPEWTVVDPSAASFVAQLYRDGLSPTLADNSVLDGIRLISSLLAAGLLLVHRSCAGWIEEVGGYSWDDKAAAKGEDRPIKDADHSLDAGRYVLKTTEALWRPHLLEAAA